ncbi:MAG TPA: MFS transporter [Kofleriaceae bacterium]|nr:MFS transporter [Kofleriaceae bacterium]
MAQRSTPPWLFGLTCIPYGVVGAFIGGVMPFLARKSGSSVSDIGWFVTLMFLPPVLQFLYAPIIDFGPRRKHWLLIVTGIGAAALVGAMAMPLPGRLVPFLAFAFVAQLISGLVGSCNGGLMATMITDDVRGRAGAWYNIGNLCGGGIFGALAVYLLGKGWEPVTVGLLLAAAMIVPALAVLAIDEPPREKGRAAGEVFGSLLRDVRGVLLSRGGATGLLLFLSPVGTAALVNFWSALATDYVRPDLLGEMAKLDATAAKALLDERAAEVVAFVNGPIGQGLTAVGALAGGYLCDRTNRRAMYLLAGALTAVCGIGMALSSPSEGTFVWGALVYALITGFCYTAFTATVLETIGGSKAAASTRYAMCVASGNLAIAYVGLIDTRFASEAHIEHVVWSDAALNLGGVVALGTVFWLLRSFGRTHHEPPAAAA